MTAAPVTDIVERYAALRKVAPNGSPYHIIHHGTINQLLDEIDALRQAIWDAYGIMGGDQDGDESHKAISFPGSSWAQHLRDRAHEWRAESDEQSDEIEALRKREGDHEEWLADLRAVRAGQLRGYDPEKDRKPWST